jgi:hypothetical protein
MESDRCPRCAAKFRPGGRCMCGYLAREVEGEFEASGTEAMATQESIVKYHAKMTMLRGVAPYFASVAFAVTAAVLIIYAPESRSTAANIAATALLVLAIGIAGFTRFSAKLPGMSLKADDKRTHVGERRDV